MDVVAMNFEVFWVADAVVGVAALPDGELGGYAVGEAAFDQAHGAFERDRLRGQEKMDVVGHDDVGVEEEVAVAAIVLEAFEEEVGVDGDLEEAA